MNAREDLKVQARKRSHKNRRGRGFSRGELRKAGINIRQALRAGFPVDVRRRTVHEENVKVAQERVRHLKPVKKRASKVKTKSSRNS